MNERIEELALKAGLLNYVDNETPRRYFIDGHADLEDVEKFAELIVRECMKEAWEEIIDDENIEAESDPLIREYLIGQNQGIVDAVIRFRNHFGFKE